MRRVDWGAAADRGILVGADDEDPVVVHEHRGGIAGERVRERPAQQRADAQRIVLAAVAVEAAQRTSLPWPCRNMVPPATILPSGCSAKLNSIDVRIMCV
jgi:hypothetical protein